MMTEESKRKQRETRIKNLGGLEAYKEYYRKQGERFGKLKIPTKGFGSNKERASKAGKKSRRRRDVKSGS